MFQNLWNKCRGYKTIAGVVIIVLWAIFSAAFPDWAAAVDVFTDLVVAKLKAIVATLGTGGGLFGGLILIIGLMDKLYRGPGIRPVDRVEKEKA